MGIMDIFSFLRRKKEPDVVPELPPMEPFPTPEGDMGSASIENVKAKIDLLLTRIDSLKTQYETLNERVKNIEAMVQEIRGYYHDYKMR